MSQRHSGRERLARDAYNTPPWPTRVLVEDLEREGVLPLRSPRHGGPLALWEPCAGLGYMASELSACGYEVYASDIDGAKSNTPCDFLTDTIWPGGVPSGIGAIITNPPYKRGLVERIIERALDHMKPHTGSSPCCSAPSSISATHATTFSEIIRPGSGRSHSPTAYIGSRIPTESRARARTTLGTCGAGGRLLTIATPRSAMPACRRMRRPRSRHAWPNAAPRKKPARGLPKPGSADTRASETRSAVSTRAAS